MISIVVVGFDPDGTKHLGTAAAWLSWTLHFLVGFEVLVLLDASLARVVTPPWLAFGLAVMAVPFIMVPVSTLIDLIFDGTPSATDAVADLAGELNRLWGDAFVAGLITLFLVRALQLLGTDEAKEGNDRPRLRSLLPGYPANVGEDLIRFEAQDHYVLVVTTDGHALVRANFADFVRSLAAWPGLQVHRSHWVATSHVAGIERAGSAGACRMSNGDSVPISRRRLPKVRAALSTRAFENKAAIL